MRLSNQLATQLTKAIEDDSVHWAIKLPVMFLMLFATPLVVGLVGVVLLGEFILGTKDGPDDYCKPSRRDSFDTRDPGDYGPD